MILRYVKKGLRVLSNPKNGVSKLSKIPFENTLVDYLQLLLFFGIISAVANLVYSVVKALYLDLFTLVEVQYLRVINYSFGRSMSLLLFYLFAGTFIVFFISLMLKPFTKKIKYTLLLQLLFYSLTPILLFGWVYYFVPGLVIWSIYLLVLGIRQLKSQPKVSKSSINQRE